MQLTQKLHIDSDSDWSTVKKRLEEEYMVLLHVATIATMHVIYIIAFVSQCASRIKNLPKPC